LHLHQPKCWTLTLPLILSKIHTVCSHDTTTVAAKLLLSIHMDPMSAMLAWPKKHLTAQECQAKALVVLGPVKILNSCNWFRAKSKLLHEAMAAHLLLPNCFYPSIWIQWVMVGWPKSIWQHKNAKPWQLLHLH
jgi:hypothetical protein